MRRRFHRGFTAAEKTALWDRWKRGKSLKAIGRKTFGKTVIVDLFSGCPAWRVSLLQLRRRCDLQMRKLPDAISDFVERHEDQDQRQLPLRLV